jgi:hypothetical protein
LAKAKQLTEAGGDWEHKNRLKVYEATFALRTRDFERAAGLLLDSVATFTTCALRGGGLLLGGVVLVCVDRCLLCICG